MGRFPPLLAASLAVLIATGGCGAPGPSLAPVSLPDVSHADAAYQQQVRASFAALNDALEREAPAAGRAAAYGRLGMLLHAGGYNDAAEPFYTNAQALAPEDARWPYHLGHLSTTKGDAQAAERHFRRALTLKPADVAIHVWLGRLLLDAGRTGEAAPLFAAALRAEPRSVAALAGLGQASLAGRDYASAVEHFERALQIDPQADSLHSPLAMAYRGLGQPEKAQPHVRQWSNRDILVTDPMRQELDMLIESGLSYELRGVRSLDASDWASAATYFRKGLDLTRTNTTLRRSLQHKLGTALFLAGDRERAAEQFEAVVAAAPPEGTADEPAARAHYSLGVIAATRQRDEQAIEHFTAALARQPSYPEAHLALGDALRRSGRVEASLPHYAEVMRLRPSASEARFAHAMGLVRLGRYRQARDSLSAAMALHPERPQFAHALARVLAASPDPGVRNGEQALAIARELSARDRTTDLGETLAMALAETGKYEEAAAVQRGVIGAARRGGASALADAMTRTLREYEAGRPCRTPWRNDHPVHVPVPPAGVGDRQSVGVPRKIGPVS